LSTTSIAASALPEEELLTASSLPKWTPVEGLSLLFGVVGVIASIKSRAQLWITKDFVRLIDARHFLRRFFLRYALRRRLIRMIFLSRSAISFLYSTVVGIVCYTEDFVVVFRFRALEEGLGFLEKIGYL
jgi:hypothetical protein